MKHFYKVLVPLIFSIISYCAFGQQNNSSWKKTFSKKGVGFVRLGDDLETTITSLQNYFVIEVDSIPVGLFNNGKYEQIYIAKDQNNKVVFKFTRSETLNTINCIELYCESYTSNKGLRIGCTLKDVKEKYKKLKVNYFFDNVLYVYPENTNYGLRLHTNSLSGEEHVQIDYGEITPESIPDKLVIDMIVIVDKKTDSKRNKKRLRQKN
ncbi:hypothetical protein [Marinifilum sp. D714]|uniref:hypothetical protein n=1 Tax=Marinifilum sp. D714 TaxID=2937523 RepID=UPI0027CAD03C|nr:hypothetical protein [Marinifilum sp. D714]MDQ2179199.1 hypothetical protein [Marinifilum sp. D714]